MNRHVAACTLFLVLATAVGSVGQDAKPKPVEVPRVGELWNDLAQPMAADPFRTERTLKEALEQIREHYRKQNDRELPILINEQSFKDEAPDAPDILEAHVKAKSFPKVCSRGQLLRDLLHSASPSATYLLRPGVVEITTHDAVSPTRLLQKKVEMKFSRQPLSFVLDEIYEQTGVHVLLDTRVGANARAPISITFTNDMTLGTGLYWIAEMAHLKLAVTDSAIVITTPFHAQFLWRTMAIPYSP